MNNVVYGKLMENLRNKVDVRLVNNKNDYLKWTPKPSFITQKLFNNNLVAIQKIKPTLTLNKPAYARICILELSRVPMYEFNDDYIKNQFRQKSILLFINTDRLVYEIETENVYEDFSKNKKKINLTN